MVICMLYEITSFYIIQNNTFQCVLATNRESSFVVFMYKEEGIQWTTGDAMPNGGVNGRFCAYMPVSEN